MISPTDIKVIDYLSVCVWWEGMTYFTYLNFGIRVRFVHLRSMPKVSLLPRYHCKFLVLLALHTNRVYCHQCPSCCICHNEQRCLAISSIVESIRNKCTICHTIGLLSYLNIYGTRRRNILRTSGSNSRIDPATDEQILAIHCLLLDKNYCALNSRHRRQSRPCCSWKGRARCSSSDSATTTSNAYGHYGFFVVVNRNLCLAVGTYLKRWSTVVDYIAVASRR